MAKITITETDLTASNVTITGDINSVAFIPIVKIVEASPTHSKVLCKSAEALETIAPANNTTGYYMAKHLLNLGMHVLVGVFEKTSAGTLSGVPAALEELKQRNLYDIRFLVAGGLDNTYNTDLVKVATERGDCIALIDHAQEPTGTTGTGTYVEKVVQSFGATSNNSKVAYFTPWCKFEISGVKDNQILPASLAYLSAYARSARTNPIYVATAGATRGVIPGLVAPVHLYGESDAGLLQSGTTTSVNPIMLVKPYGYVVWGNRTSLPGATKLKASNFLNISVLITEIVKNLTLTYNRYAFEQNTDVLWVNFKAQIRPVLDRMKSGLGILDYKLVKVKTATKGKLKAIVKIIPVEGTEDFDITIELADSLEITVA